MAGKQLFAGVKAVCTNPDMVGGVQAISLGIITVGTLLYTIHKSRIRTRKTDRKLVCLMIGLVLGIISSFLGIGGGPINLVVLGYCFSMDTKTAAANSMYIILFSQVASLLATLMTGSVPQFRISTLALMVAGGIGGGIVGRKPKADPIETALESVRGQLASLQAQQDTICEYLEKGIYTIDMFTKRNSAQANEIRQL